MYSCVLTATQRHRVPHNIRTCGGWRLKDGTVVKNYLLRHIVRPRACYLINGRSMVPQRVGFVGGDGAKGVLRDVVMGCTGTLFHDCICSLLFSRYGDHVDGHIRLLSENLYLAWSQLSRLGPDMVGWTDVLVLNRRTCFCSILCSMLASAVFSNKVHSLNTMTTPTTCKIHVPNLTTNIPWGSVPNFQSRQQVDRQGFFRSQQGAGVPRVRKPFKVMLARPTSHASFKSMSLWTFLR